MQKPALLTDNGSGYISQVMEAYLRSHEMRHIRTRSHHPQTTGKIERMRGAGRRHPGRRLVRQEGSDPGPAKSTPDAHRDLAVRALPTAEGPVQRCKSGNAGGVANFGPPFAPRTLTLYTRKSPTLDGGGE